MITHFIYDRMIDVIDVDCLISLLDVLRERYISNSGPMWANNIIIMTDLIEILFQRAIFSDLTAAAGAAGAPPP